MMTKQEPFKDGQSIRFRAEKEKILERFNLPHLKPLRGKNFTVSGVQETACTCGGPHRYAGFSYHEGDCRLMREGCRFEYQILDEKKQIVHDLLLPQQPNPWWAEYWFEQNEQPAA